MASEERIERALFHRHDLLLDRLDDGQVSVDDVVEDGVKHVVDPLRELGGGGFELRAQRLMRARGAVAYADDMVAADEERRFAVIDVVVAELSGSRDDEQLIAVDIDLGQLIGVDGIFDR